MSTISGGFGGCGRTLLASFRKIQGLPISNIVKTADCTIIIISNFYLAASSHEIFLRVGGIEGMRGLGALQRHQLPHLPCKNPGSATVYDCFVLSLCKAVTTEPGLLNTVAHAVCMQSRSVCYGSTCTLGCHALSYNVIFLIL